MADLDRPSHPFPPEAAGLWSSGQQNVRPPIPCRPSRLQRAATDGPRTRPTAPDGARTPCSGPRTPTRRLPLFLVSPGSGGREAIIGLFQTEALIREALTNLKSQSKMQVYQSPSGSVDQDVSCCLFLSFVDRRFLLTVGVLPMIAAFFFLDFEKRGILR